MTLDTALHAALLIAAVFGYSLIGWGLARDVRIKRLRALLAEVTDKLIKAESENRILFGQIPQLLKEVDRLKQARQVPGEADRIIDDLVDALDHALPRLFDYKQWHAHAIECGNKRSAEIDDLRKQLQQAHQQRDALQAEVDTLEAELSYALSRLDEHAVPIRYAEYIARSRYGILHDASVPGRVQVWHRARTGFPDKLVEFDGPDARAKAEAFINARLHGDEQLDRGHDDGGR